MRALRRRILEGYPSLVTAEQSVLVAARGSKPSPAQKPRSVREALGVSTSVPRPPGMADDHPLVTQGVYA